MLRKDQLRRISARRARPDSEREEPFFKTELGEFDPEVYSQDPLAEDRDMEVEDA